MLVGVLGGGQLGRMLALAGYPLGLRFRFLDPSADACAAQVGDLLVGTPDDHTTLERFADGCGVITCEFENIPAATLDRLAAIAPVYPPAQAFELGQDRLREKTLLRELRIPTPEFAAVDTAEDLAAAFARIGVPAVLKTRRLGYDGKGQRVLRTPADLEPAWTALGGRPLILESFVPFSRELSILGVRGRDGATAFYPLIENEHRAGLLARSLAPVEASAELNAAARDFCLRLMQRLDYVGVLALELFEVGGRLLANEYAPRVHNSGHWTIEGAQTSQFENHLRAILGWTLGATAARGHSVMLNVVGAPFPLGILNEAGAHLHWYGKQPRPGRKVGHVTIVRDTPAEALAAAARVAQSLA